MPLRSSSESQQGALSPVSDDECPDNRACEKYVSNGVEIRESLEVRSSKRKQPLEYETKELSVSSSQEKSVSSSVFSSSASNFESSAHSSIKYDIRKRHVSNDIPCSSSIIYDGSGELEASFPSSSVGNVSNATFLNQSKLNTMLSSSYSAVSTANASFFSVMNNNLRFPSASQLSSSASECCSTASDATVFSPPSFNPFANKQTSIVSTTLSAPSGGAWRARGHATHAFSDQKHNGHQECHAAYLSPCAQEWLDAHPEIDKAAALSGLVNFFPEAEIRQNLNFLQTTQPAIDAASVFMSQFISPPGPLFKIMAEEYLANDSPSNCLAIFYLFNHLIQNYHNVNLFNNIDNDETFAEVSYNRFLRVVASKIAQQADNRKYLRCVKIWQERGIFNRQTCQKLQYILSPAGTFMGDLASPSSTIINNLGALIPLSIVLETPCPGKACRHARNTHTKLSSPETKFSKQMLSDLGPIILEKASARFDRASRLTGQEIILLQIALLDLSFLIEANQNSIMDIKNLLENELPRDN